MYDRYQQKMYMSRYAHPRITTKIEQAIAGDAKNNKLVEIEEAKSKTMTYEKLKIILEQADGEKIDKVDQSYWLDIYVDNTEHKKVLEGLGTAIWELAILSIYATVY